MKNVVDDAFLSDLRADILTSIDRLQGASAAQAALALRAVLVAVTTAQVKQAERTKLNLEQRVAQLEAERDLHLAEDDRYDCPIHGTGEGSDCPRC